MLHKLLSPRQWSANPTTGQVLSLFVVSLLLLFCIGAPLQQWNLEIGLFLSLTLLVFGTTIAALYLGGCHWKTTLSVQSPPGLALVLPIFFVPAMIVIIAELMAYQNQIFPMPRELLKSLESLGGEPQNAFEFGLVIFLIAFLPAVCEEIMFRGYALSGLRQRLSPFRAVLITAIAFGIFHLSIYRLMPTTLIGLLLGWLTIRTGSIFPAIWTHLLYNAYGLFLLHIPAFQDNAWIHEPGHVSPLLLIAAVVFLAGSLALVPKGKANSIKRGDVNTLEII